MGAILPEAPETYLEAIASRRVIMDLHLTDQTALVTGSTAGIGLEIARKLAVEGARVIVTGRDRAKLDRAVAGIKASGGSRVTVNVVMPGPTRSDGIVDFLKSASSDPDAPAEEIEAEFFAKHRSSSLLQRMIEPEEIADLVAFIASPLSAATNGAALRAEGGLVSTIA